MVQKCLHTWRTCVARSPRRVHWNCFHEERIRRNVWPQFGPGSCIHISNTSNHQKSHIVGVSISDNYIQRYGHALVWVVRPTTNHLPLTGAYNWSVNGIDQGKQIIFLNRADNNFLLARTADDEIEKIRLRLEALTNSNIWATVINAGWIHFWRSDQLWYS